MCLPGVKFQGEYEWLILSFFGYYLIKTEGKDKSYNLKSGISKQTRKAKRQKGPLTNLSLLTKTMLKLKITQLSKVNYYKDYT